MSPRVPKELRAKIQKDNRPVRVIAAELGISPTTVQRIKRSESLDDRSRVPEGRPKLGPFEEGILFEMTRLSRYHYKKLIEYLAPAWSAIPSRSRQIENKKQQNSYLIASTTFYWRLRRYASGVLLECYDRESPTPGSVGVHKIKIDWEDSRGRTREGDILLLQERASGLLYAKAFSDKIQTRSVATCIERFEKMYGNEIQSLHFITHYESRTDPSDKSTKTTVLNEPSSRRMRSTLLPEFDIFDVQLFTDNATPHQKNRVAVPGTYESIHELNKSLKELTNKINLAPRHHYIKRSRIEMSPLKKIIEHHQSIGKTVSEKRTIQRIKRR